MDQTSVFLFTPLTSSSGPAFIPYLDNIPPLSREETGPFRLPIADKYKVHILHTESESMCNGANRPFLLRMTDHSYLTMHM